MPRVEEEIKQDVVDQLAWDDRVNAAEIDVEVHDSTVVLRGSVPSWWARTSAVEDAESVPGVVLVEDQLTVRWPPVYAPTDTELWDDVDRALRRNPNVDASRISIGVSDGTVSLDGTVDAYWKKLQAERIASDVTGVLEVENRLAVVPTSKITDERIASDIVGSLKRNALVDEERVDVMVSNGIVTLNGSVPNWATRRAVRRAAHLTPGVVNVHDNLVVAV